MAVLTTWSCRSLSGYWVFDVRYCFGSSTLWRGSFGAVAAARWGFVVPNLGGASSALGSRGCRDYCLCCRHVCLVYCSHLFGLPAVIFEPGFCGVAGHLRYARLRQYCQAARVGGPRSVLLSLRRWLARAWALPAHLWQCASKRSLWSIQLRLGGCPFDEQQKRVRVCNVGVAGGDC